jgi:hypothetical protein
MAFRFDGHRIFPSIAVKTEAIFGVIRETTAFRFDGHRTFPSIAITSSNS